MIESIGEYTIERELGVGGKARVFLAHKKGRGREFAVKCYFPAPHYLSGDSLSKKAAKDFHMEVGNLDQMDSPYVVSLYEYGIDETTGIQYIVMDRLSETLKERMKRQFQLAEKLNIISCMAKGVAHIHDRDVVHNDLKPSNIMFKGDIPVIMDLGISKSLLETLDGTGVKPDHSIQGTLPYMAPEVLEGNAGTKESDAYALGLMAYELLTGANPFYLADAKAEAIEYRIRNVVPGPISKYVPALPDEIATAIERLLLKSPKERATFYSDALSALMRCSKRVIEPVEKEVTSKPPVAEKPKPATQTGQISRKSYGNAWDKLSHRILGFYHCKPAYNGKMKPISASPKGPLVAVGGDELLSINLTTEKIEHLKGPIGRSNRVDISFNGGTLLSWTRGGTATVWNTRKTASTHTFGSDVQSAAIHHNGLHVAIREQNKGEVQLWSTTNGRKGWTIYGLAETYLRYNACGRRGLICVGISETGEGFFLYTSRTNIAIRDKQRNYIDKLESPIKTASRLFSSSSTQLYPNLITGHLDNSLKLWYLGHKRPKRSYAWHEGQINSIDVSYPATQIVSCADDGQIILWNLRTGERIDIIETPSVPLTVCFALDGKHIVSSHKDGSVVLWKTLQ